MSTQVSRDLHDRLMDRITQSVEMDEPPEALAVAIEAICFSVHQNAVAYGRLLGEEMVLTAAVTDELNNVLAADWLAVVRRKITEARRDPA